MKLTKKHRTAIELLIEGNMSKTDIAQSVNVSRQTLNKWLNDTDFKDEYDEQIKEIERRFKRRICNMTAAALDRQENILKRSKNDIAAASVAKDILDRAGYAPDDNINIEMKEQVIIVDDIPRGGSK